MYNLNYLEAFLGLAETLSFTQTAKILKISQPSVSRQIQLLEDQLKTPLFLRNRNKVHLSPAGEKLHAALSPVMKEMMAVLGETEWHSSELQGSLSFGSLAEMGQALFMKPLLEFHKLYPQMAINMELATEIEIKRKLTNGTLDFGILTRLEKSDVLRFHLLFYERAVLLTRSSNKRKKLQREQFVLFRKDDPLLENFLRLYKKHLGISSIHPFLIVNSHKLMQEALLASDCYAVLPYLSAKEKIENGELKIASEFELKNPVYLASPNYEHSEKKSLAFRKHLLSYCRTLNA